MDHRSQSPRADSRRKPGRPVPFWLGFSLFALIVALICVLLCERRTLALILGDPRLVAGLLILLLATIGLGIGLTTKQQTVAAVAVVAMVLSGSCTAITFFFGGRVRDLTPIMHMRLGEEEAEPKGLPHKK